MTVQLLQTLASIRAPAGHRSRVSKLCNPPQALVLQMLLALWALLAASQHNLAALL